MMRRVALEVEFRSRGKRSGLLRLAFATANERDACFRTLQDTPATPPRAIAAWSLGDATRAWQRRELDNFSSAAESGKSRASLFSVL